MYIIYALTEGAADGIIEDGHGAPLPLREQNLGVHLGQVLLQPAQLPVGLLHHVGNIRLGAPVWEQTQIVFFFFFWGTLF